MLSLQINSPFWSIFKFFSTFLKEFYRLCIRNFGKVRFYQFFSSLFHSWQNKLIKEINLGNCVFEHIRKHIFDHILSKLHIIFQISKSNFWFNHPKLCKMSSRVGIFSTEGWSKGINFPKSRSKSLSL